jgi:hypothetical protein
LGEELVTQTSYKKRDSNSGHLKPREFLTLLENPSSVKEEAIGRKAVGGRWGKSKPVGGMWYVGKNESVGGMW